VDALAPGRVASIIKAGDGVGRIEGRDGGAAGLQLKLASGAPASEEGWAAAAASLEAEELLSYGLRALSTMGPERGTSSLIVEVSDMLRRAGRLPEARHLLEEAWHTRRDAHGEKAASTLTALNNWSAVLLDTAAMYEAERLLPPIDEKPGSTPEADYERAEKAAGPAAKADKAAAKKQLAVALQARREVQGDLHVETLTAINNMGAAHLALGEVSKAEALYRECLRGRRSLLGDDDPDTLTSVNNLGLLLMERGKLVESGKLLVEAFHGAGYSPALGWDHEHTQIFRDNLNYNRELRARARVWAAKRAKDSKLEED